MKKGILDFLIEIGILDLYLLNYIKYNNFDSSGKQDLLGIFCAFRWNNTKEGSEFWCEINRKYELWKTEF